MPGGVSGLFCDFVVLTMDTDTAATSAGERHSVSELVRSYGDALSDGHGGGKRDRSESGDQAPAGKRGAPEPESSRSPAPRNISGMKEYLEVALEKLEDRITSSISKDLHEFRELITTELGALTDRVRDLERHVEHRWRIAATCGCSVTSVPPPPQW